jgi:hypothetical protein
MTVPVTIRPGRRKHLDFLQLQDQCRATSVVWALDGQVRMAVSSVVPWGAQAGPSFAGRIRSSETKSDSAKSDGVVHHFPPPGAFSLFLARLGRVQLTRRGSLRSGARFSQQNVPARA